MRSLAVTLAALLFLAGGPWFTFAQSPRTSPGTTQQKKQQPPAPKTRKLNKGKPAAQAAKERILPVDSSSAKIGLAQEQSPLPPKTSTTSPPEVVRDPKLPGLALGLSALLPGAGQYYNGDYVKGAIQTGLFVTGIVLALTMGTESSYQANPYTDYSYYGTYTYYRPSSGDETTAWMYVGLGLAGGAWLWSVIDAPLSASSMNRGSDGVSYGHMLQVGVQGHAIGMDLASGPCGTGFNVTLHF